MRNWLMDARSAPLIDSLAASDGLLAPYVNRGELDLLIARHRAGSIDATDRIWRLMNLQIWGDIFISGKRTVAEFSRPVPVGC